LDRKHKDPRSSCGTIASHEVEIDDSEEVYESYEHEEYDDDTGFLESTCLDVAQKVLVQWATALDEAKPAKDKKRMLERLVDMFSADLYPFDSEDWEEAFKIAVGTASEAKLALVALKKRVKRLYQQQDKGGVLLHLLELSGETERFLKVGRRVVKTYHHLALPLGEKLVTLGHRAEAFEMVESVLAEFGNQPYSYGHYGRRSELYRFLLRVGNRRRDHRRLVECAKVLLFTENKLDDYFFLRDLLRNRAEKEDLIEEIKEECTGEALIAIFSAEERWEDLLDAARKHHDDSAFHLMIKAAQDRFPAECFDLYRKVVLDLADSDTDRRIYRQVAFHARRLQTIPGHEQAFAELMAGLVETYSRRRGLMEELGDLAALGKAWLDQVRQTRLERVSAKQMKGMDIGELVAVCPISDAEQEKLGRRTTWQRGSTGLVWAVLKSQGGRLDAADITAAIAAYRGCTQQSAGSQRSNGIRMLEALGYIKVEREKNKLGEVRLIKR
jgi:hypothetical protein